MQVPCTGEDQEVVVDLPSENAGEHQERLVWCPFADSDLDPLLTSLKIQARPINFLLPIVSALCSIPTEWNY